jgi:Skp family chaperone for outer membrane proteins
MEEALMVRWSVLTAGLVVVVGAALVTGTSIPPRPLAGPARPAEIKAPVLGQKTGYFNMAKVMRESRRARAAVERLEAKRMRLLANLVGLKAMATELQALHQKTTDANEKYLISRDVVMLARQIEDLDREANKLLNNQASEVIVELYDEIHTEAVDLARENSLVALLAYPDAVTPEEIANPMVKEQKLRPPATQPFYLDPSVDYTDELIQRLNARVAAANDGK